VGHETDVSFATEEGGFGVACNAQCFPFQRSTSAPVPLFPTAVHAEGEEHDTAWSAPLRTRGVAWSVQAVPFHDSMTGPLASTPTATHEVDAGQATPLNQDLVALGSAGVGSAVQTVPFQSSASVTPSPAGFAAEPTAMQEVATGHDTPASQSLPLPSCAGFGEGTADQVGREGRAEDAITVVGAAISAKAIATMTHRTAESRRACGQLERFWAVSNDGRKLSACARFSPMDAPPRAQR